MAAQGGRGRCAEYKLLISTSTTTNMTSSSSWQPREEKKKRLSVSCPGMAKKYWDSFPLFQKEREQGCHFGAIKVG